MVQSVGSNSSLVLAASAARSASTSVNKNSAGHATAGADNITSPKELKRSAAKALQQLGATQRDMILSGGKATKSNSSASARTTQETILAGLTSTASRSTKNVLSAMIQMQNISGAGVTAAKLTAAYGAINTRRS